MRNTIFEEDRLLAKAAGTPSESKPRFDWADALGDNASKYPKYALLMARVIVISTSPRWPKSLGRH